VFNRERLHFFDGEGGETLRPPSSGSSAPL
jgi:hypothetical protein